MLHFSKLQPQRAPILHAHRDSVSQGRLCQVLSSEGLPCPLHTDGEEKFQLQLQLKVQQVAAFPALRDVSLLQEATEQPKTTTGTLCNLLKLLTRETVCSVSSVAAFSLADLRHL